MQSSLYVLDLSHFSPVLEMVVIVVSCEMLVQASYLIILPEGFHALEKTLETNGAQNERLK